MENAIEIVHVTKKFKETVAVNGVTVSLERGKIHGIIGRNGSGKTVLFKCICGLFPVTEGEITVLGLRTCILWARRLSGSIPLSGRPCS